MARRILISVSSDLVTDQRVNRTAMTLKDAGYHVMLIGRVKSDSPEMPARRYRSKRFRLLFEKGPLFYATLNLRLFWFLFWNHADILIANDLDTLLPNYLISKIKRIPLVYDSHEYFTGVPELQNRKHVQNIWKKIERYIVPKLRYAFTVNDSIAKLYKEEYGVNFGVIRNVPLPDDTIYPDKTTLRTSLNLPADEFIFILQGAGINMDRGAEEAVEAMQFTKGLLLIVGNGDVIPQLKEKVAQLQLEKKVKFVPRQNPVILRRYTRAADAGLTLDKDTNINYKFSLPNKLFDYLQAGIPVLASNLPEVVRVVNEYNAGLIAYDHDPRTLASLMEKISDPILRAEFKPGINRAATELHWGKEKEKLVKLINSIV
jgi:glycosyltransferase involved in cell wall biosynthesis